MAAQAARRTNDSGRRRPQQDRLADPGAEGLAVEDHLGCDSPSIADFVGFLDMDPGHLGPAEPADQAGEEGAQQRHRLLLDRDELERPVALRADLARQQQLLQRGHEQQGEAAGDRALAAHARR